MYRQNQENIGSFIEKEFKCDSGRTLRARPEFTYHSTKDEWAIEQGYKHEIDCGTIPNGSDSCGFNGKIRIANVKKTVVYILCDDEVEQKWLLAKNTVFKTI